MYYGLLIDGYTGMYTTINIHVYADAHIYKQCHKQTHVFTCTGAVIFKAKKRWLHMKGLLDICNIHENTLINKVDNSRRVSDILDTHQSSVKRKGQWWEIQ